MIKRIIKVGNSVGVIFDKFILTELGWSGGDLLEVAHDPRQRKMTVRKLGRAAEDQRKRRRYWGERRRNKG